MDRAEFVCPACGNTVLAPRSLAGRAAPCPKCKSHVPTWPEPIGGGPPPAPLPPRPVPIPPPAPPPAVPPRTTVLRLAWVAAALIGAVALAAVIGIEASYSERKRWYEEERRAADARRAEYRYGDIDRWRSWDRTAERVEEMGHEMDSQRRVQAITNIAFSALVLASAFALVTVFARRATPFRDALAWGCLAAGVLGLSGALVSQLAPVFGDFITRRLVRPFSLAQLSILLEHTLSFAVVGLVLGSGAITIRTVSNRSAA